MQKTSRWDQQNHRSSNQKAFQRFFFSDSLPYTQRHFTKGISTPCLCLIQTPHLPVPYAFGTKGRLLLDILATGSLAYINIKIYIYYIDINIGNCKISVPFLGNRSVIPTKRPQTGTTTNHIHLCVHIGGRSPFWGGEKTTVLKRTTIVK